MRTVSHSLFLLLVALSFMACATVGNEKIKHVTPEQLQGMTKAELIAAYGPPTMKQTTLKDGHWVEQYTWSFASVGPGYVESAAFSVVFDEKNTISTVITNMTSQPLISPPGSRP